MLHDLADRLRAGETVIGTWLFTNDLGAAEIVAGAGFDFVVIDMEHGATGFDNVRNMIMAIERHTAPMVRVKGNSPAFITAVLDLGAAGVIVPQVNTADEARQAVKSAKYHPVGERGCGPIRVSDYGRNPQYVDQANAKQMVWVQIEHRDAVNNIEQIVRVPGIDAFLIGRGDMSQSMGHLLKPNHPEVTAAAMRAVEAMKKANVPFGSAFADVAELEPWLDTGMRLYTIQSDQRFLRDRADQVLADTKAMLGTSNARPESSAE